MRSASLFFFRTVQSFLGSRSNGSVLIVKIGTARMAVRHLLFRRRDTVFVKLGVVRSDFLLFRLILLVDVAHSEIRFCKAERTRKRRC